MRWRRRRTDEDFREEIRAHVAHEADRLVAEGTDPQHAHDDAHRAFGNLLRAQERFHDAHRWTLAEQLLLDVRYAWRGLRKSRSAAATLSVTLGVALALVTVVFAVFNAYVLRPFAVRDPHSLVAIGWQAAEASGRGLRWADYEEVRGRSDLFDAVIAEDSRLVFSEGRMLAVGFVSGNYFDALAPRMRLGRPLQPNDTEPVAVLTEQAWTRLFDRDPSVIGRDLALNHQRLTIVGVMRREFSGLDDSPRDAWVPVAAYRAVVGLDPFAVDAPRAFDITARLRRGVTAAQAQGALTLPPFEAREPGRRDAVRPVVERQATPSTLTFETAVLLAPVAGAFVLVLLAACANASNVMLARALARHREIGVRLSIGASRSRIVRQLLTEALLISLLAGLVGLALASVTLRIGVPIFIAMVPPSVAGLVRVVPLDFDYRVFLFALASAGLTTIVFALLPALQATRLTLMHALRGEVSGSTRGARLRGALVALQVAVSLALIVGAATLVRNGRAMKALELGFRTDRITSVNVRGTVDGAAGAAALALASDAAVAGLAVASRNPLFGAGPRVPVESPDGAPRPMLSYTFVSPRYFQVLDIPILRGRGFLPEEGRHEAAVAIVGATAARALWPGADPIGRTIRVALPPVAPAATTRLELARPGKPETTTLTVVGVAQDVVGEFIYSGRGDTARLYLPTDAGGTRADALLVRTYSRPQDAKAALDRVLQRVHPDPLTFESIPLDEMVSIQLFPLRVAYWIGCILGGVALVLSVSGLHGVLSYTLGQRVREIGIRMALGASARAVVALVMRQTARMAGVGAAAGLLFAYAVLRLLAAVVPLSNVAFVDGPAFATSVTLVTLAALFASCGPARRATRVDPAVTLRADG